MWLYYYAKIVGPFSIVLYTTHPSDKAAMLVYTKQKQNVARVLHNNRAKFPKDFFANVQYSNMAANDVRWKPRIVILL